MDDTKRFTNQSSGSFPYNISPVEKWTVQKRWAGLFKSPSKAMANIAERPNYGEAAFVVLLHVILTSIAVGVSISKMRITGPYASTAWSYVSSPLVFAMILTAFLMFIFWAVRAGLVLIICQGSSGWNFKSAATVTGYAIVPVLFIYIVYIIVMGISAPSVTLDTSNIESMELAVATFSQQATTYKITVTIPFTIVMIIAQAIIGAFGVQAGTNGQRSYATGFVVFFLVGCIDLLLMFL